MALNDTYIDNGVTPTIVLQMISIAIYSPTRKQQMFIFDTFFFSHISVVFLMYVKRKFSLTKIIFVISFIT